MVNLNDLDLLQILPASISGDKNVQAIAKALPPDLQSVSRDTREALIVSRIDELPDAILDLLAWQWHVDFYEPERLSLESKRNLVKSSIPMHRKKGTKWAVEETLRAIGIEPEITEWFEYGGEPYRFRVNGMIRRPLSPGETWGSDTYSLARRAIMETKSERSWLDSLNLGILFDFGDITFLWRLARRRERRHAHAVWSLLPRFDFLPADAIPLDWRPWKGYLRPIMTMRTTGEFTGVSRLDRYLSLDSISTDAFPLDTTMPYIETENPPILTAFLKRENRTASGSIRAPTCGVSRQRRTFDLRVKCTARSTRRKQVYAGTARPAEKPDHIDDFLTFDSIPADLSPLDKALPYREGNFIWR